MKRSKPKWLKEGVEFEIGSEEEAAKIMEEYLSADDFRDAVSKDISNADSKTRSATKKKAAFGKAMKVDLHSLNVRQAKAQLDRLFNSTQFENPTKDFQIVTGKGRHSGPGGGILIKEIYYYVATHYKTRVQKIDSDPSKDLINGLPLRGFFYVRISR